MHLKCINNNIFGNNPITKLLNYNLKKLIWCDVKAGSSEREHPISLSIRVRVNRPTVQIAMEPNIPRNDSVRHAVLFLGET